MKRLLFSIACAVGVYLVAGALVLAVSNLPGKGPTNINIFDSPFGFYGIFVAVGAIASGVLIYWRLEPNRLARARERRNRQR